MAEQNDGGPAGVFYANQRMTLREYAAIKLCVPDSGTDWLNDMIRQSQRDRFAGMAMQGILASSEGRRVIQECSKVRKQSEADFLFEVTWGLANEMLAERAKREGSNDA